MSTLHTDTLSIQGMSCAHCVRAVEQALQDVEGVEVDEVAIGTARVRYDAEQVDRSQLVEAIEEEGFTVA